MPTQSQIEANRRTPQNSTGPTSVTGKAVSSMNSLKTGTQAKLLPSPRKRRCDPPVCVTKSPTMSATHSNKKAYPHTTNIPGFQILRHNAPVPAATRPIAHSRNPLPGQLGKAARHPEGIPFPRATGGADPEPASPRKLNHLPHKLASFRHLPLPPRQLSPGPPAPKCRTPGDSAHPPLSEAASM